MSISGQLYLVHFKYLKKRWSV